MAGGPIQFSGLASGLDTQAIINALVKAESVPIQQLNSQKSKEQSKITLLGTLDGHLKALRTRANELSTLGGLQSVKIQTSTTGIATFTVKGSPLPATHALEVEQLATSDRWVFAGQPSATASLGAGEIQFTYDGTAHTVTIEPDKSSLNAIAKAINEQAGTAVTASVVNTGTTASPSWQLIVAGKSSGAAHAIVGLSSTVAGLAQTTQLSTAGNAKFKLDGLAIERATNTFSDVINGVEIRLEATTTTPLQVTLGADTQGVKDKLKSFVDAFNKVVDFINGQSKYTEAGGASGALFGDPVLKSVRGRLNEALYGAQSVNGNSAFGGLGVLGIELQNDGTLKLNDKKVDAKIAADFDAFLDFFVDLDGFDNGGAPKGTPAHYVDISSDKGLFSIVSKSIDRMLDSQNLGNGKIYKGLIAARRESLEKTVKNLDTRMEQLEERLESFRANLVQRFSALEKLMSGLQSQGAFLSQKLGG